jgi:hypothetical protein
LELPFTLTGELKGKKSRKANVFDDAALLVMPFVGY